MGHELGKKFKDKFGLPAYNFLEPVDLVDTKIGFTVLKTTEKKEYKSLFRFYIKDEELDKEGDKKPILISATYGKEYEDGIILYSTAEEVRSLNSPVNFISHDEFYYDIKTNKFYDKKKEVTGIEILKRIDDLHTKPTKLVRGFILRIKLWFWGKLMLSVTSSIPNFFIYFLYIISGTKITKNLWERKFKKERIKPENYQIHSMEQGPEKLDIFGYKASKWSITFYCLVHLFVFYLYKATDTHWKPVTGFFQNNFLVVMYVIPSLGFFDSLLPRLLKYLIDKTSNLAAEIAFKKINL
jgi:hypothetical protein